jgi:hypothetical protein
MRRVEPAAVTPAPPPVKTSSSTALRVAGWSALGIGAAASAAAVFLGVRALSARDAYYANPSSEADLDTARSLRLWTNVAWASAAVFAVGGIVTLIVARSDPEPTVASGF